MSFFFTKTESKSVKSLTSNPKVNKKEVLNRLGCQGCPLDKVDNVSPKMQPDAADKTDIYFLGDMPDATDDEKGRPFESKAGRVLRRLIGSDLATCTLDNVIRDYGHKSADPTWVPMEACRSHITKSIEHHKPKVIVGLGILPLQWMLGSADMIGLRGRVFAVTVGQHQCYFIPTYHPQHVLDNAYNQDEPLWGKFGMCLKFDLDKAFKVLHWGPPRVDTPQQVRAGIQTFNGREATHLAAVLKLISEAAKAPMKTIDLETWPLRPYAEGAQLLTIAISFGETNFAFAYNHPRAGWSPNQKAQLRTALRQLLQEESRIIAHNALFEIEWLTAELGKDTIYHDDWDCTMMQSHFLDERRGKKGGHDDQFQPNPYQALDFLVKQYFGIAYKGVFKLDRKHMDKADLDETLLYNGADTKYTLRLFNLQTWLLKEQGLWKAYVHAKSRQPSAALLQTMGIHLDQKQISKFKSQLSNEIDEITADIKDLTEVQKFIKDHGSFNPASSAEVIKLLKDYIKVGKILLNGEGRESTDKSVLGKISHPFARLLDNFRNRSKLLSTYVDPFIQGSGNFVWPDGKIHPALNTTFTETGRTSADSPNQQNWPKREDGWVRRQIVAPKGHVLVAFDYGQLEACTTAFCTRDKVLVKYLWEEYDVHMEWAIKMAKLYPPLIGGIKYLNDKQVMKDFRGIMKNKMVFPAFFGARNESVCQYLRLVSGLDVPQDKVDALMEEFWSTFAGVRTWQKQTMSKFYEVGYVESPTGRRRHYPLSKNQAVNYPIQSVACDLTCSAMVTLSKLAADTGKWYLHPIWNIHDDLGLCIPDDPEILDDALETICKAMLKPDLSFINVPISVEGSIGTTWENMKEIGKYWSNKDV